VKPELVEQLMRLTFPKEMVSEVPALMQSLQEEDDDEEEDEGGDVNVDAALAQGAARKKKKRSKLRKLGTKFKKGIKSSVGIKHVGTTETITKLEEALVQVTEDRAKLVSRLQVPVHDMLVIIHEFIKSLLASAGGRGAFEGTRAAAGSQDGRSGA
jgi:hypothetical protein